MIVLSYPFKFIYRLIGTILGAILLSTLFGGLILLVLGVAALLVFAAMGFVAWIALFALSAMIGNALISVVRVFDPEYRQGQKSPTDQVADLAKGGAGGLRDIARDHL